MNIYGLRYRNNQDLTEGWCALQGKHLTYNTKAEAESARKYMSHTYPGWLYSIRFYPSGLNPDAWDDTTPVTSAPSVAKVRDEKPCPLPGCSAKNDRGVKSCWSCGHPNPYPGHSDDQALADAIAELASIFH